MNIPRDPTTQLDERLAILARQPIPESPANLGADVWREIRRHQTGSAASWVTVLLDLFHRPFIAITAFAFTIALGTFFGAIGARHTTSDIYMARQSLHLEVFAPDASGLPAAFAGHR